MNSYEIIGNHRKSEEMTRVTTDNKKWLEIARNNKKWYDISEHKKKLPAIIMGNNRE